MLDSWLAPWPLMAQLYRLIAVLLPLWLLLLLRLRL
jgi:hypothetical protein